MPTRADPNHRAEWDSAAAGWAAHGASIGAWLGPATEVMLRMAGVGPGMRVLDVAAGAGEPTLRLAECVGPGGHVLACDVSPAMLALARTAASARALTQVETRLADGQALGLPDDRFDAAVCRLGLMLFDEPLRALREMQRVLRPGARCGVMVFSTAAANPCVAGLLATALAAQDGGAAAVPPCAGTPPPGSLFSLGPPGRLAGLFAEAGFEQVSTVRVDAPFWLDSARHYLDFVRDAAEPIRRLVDRLSAERQAATWQAMHAQLTRYERGGAWCGPNELLIACGRKPWLPLRDHAPPHPPQTPLRSPS